uniref:Uncharacterized protein n=1 Tax=Leersia perrieri TaxID=77586 RepID=A0A0D9UZJ9_9ORYZ
MSENTNTASQPHQPTLLPTSRKLGAPVSSAIEKRNLYGGSLVLTIASRSEETKPFWRTWTNTQDSPPANALKAYCYGPIGLQKHQPRKL